MQLLRHVESTTRAQKLRQVWWVKAELQSEGTGVVLIAEQRWNWTRHTEGSACVKDIGYSIAYLDNLKISLCEHKEWVLGGGVVAGDW